MVDCYVTKIIKREKGKQKQEEQIKRIIREIKKEQRNSIKVINSKKKKRKRKRKRSNSIISNYNKRKIKSLKI